MSPDPLQKIASVSPELKAVLPKIETHCIFVALLGELHWPVHVVVHHLSEILHGLWPDPLAVQGANCLGLPVVDGSTEICHRIFGASPASFFVRHAFCEAPVGLPFFTWRVTESVEFLLGHPTLGELRVIVNLWQDKDATSFQVRAVGQRPARKSIKSRRFVERELELFLLADGTVAKPNQIAGQGERNPSHCSASRRCWAPPRLPATNSCGRQKRRRRQTRRTCPTRGPAPALSLQLGWDVSERNHRYDKTQSVPPAGTWPSTKVPRGRSWRRGEGPPRTAS